MARPSLHFIGQHAGAPTLIVEWCRRQWPDTLPEGLYFCVPTALSFRRLRDALTAAYGAFQGVHFLMPSQLFELFTPPLKEPPATLAETLCAWDWVFDWVQTEDPQTTLADFLFPERKNWIGRAKARYVVAQRLMALRATLVEQCLDFTTVAERVKALPEIDEREQVRWAALAALETRYREVLADAGLEDAIDRQREILLNPVAQPQEGSSDWRLVMACVPDFMPSLQRLMEVAPACDILVQADPSQRDCFTDEGLPKPAFWTTAHLDLPDCAIHFAEKPAYDAQIVEQFLNTFGEVDPADLCLTILNRESMPGLTASLNEHGVSVFEPDPIALRERPPARILSTLFSLASRGTPKDLLQLIAFPEVCAIVNADYTTLRERYNLCMEAHRPQRLNDFATFLTNPKDAPLVELIACCTRWIEAIQQDLISGTRALLIELYGSQTLHPLQEPLRFATFEALRNLLNELSGLRLPLTTPPSVELFTACLSEVSLHPIRQGAECSYEGRLELLWSEAPILILSGLNEHFFPDTTFEDSFLPNAFRKTLGLRSDVNRVARDAYLLSTAVAMHAPEKTCLIYAQMNQRGDWLKPSRLLFHCDPETQRKRAQQAFVDSPAQSAILTNESALAFVENPVAWCSIPPLPKRLSSSAIKLFLDSPLEYWLKYCLHLEDTQPLPEGLPPNTFGTLLHTVLTPLKRWTETSEEALAQRLLDELDACITKTYGKMPDMEVLAARYDAQNRLRAFAKWEAQSRAEGWQTQYAESDTKTWEYTLLVDGHPIALTGQIDRVDKNIKTGAWRIVDYKTGNLSKTNATKMHVTRLKDGTYQWHLFQLPIYRLIGRKVLNLSPNASFETAYLALPSSGLPSYTSYTDPESEALTTDALVEVLRAILSISAQSLPADLSPYGSTLLSRLTLPTCN